MFSGPRMRTDTGTLYAALSGASRCRNHIRSWENDRGAGSPCPRRSIAGPCPDGPSRSRSAMRSAKPAMVSSLEQITQREVHLESLLDARHDLRGQQRVPAQLEEVVVDSDPLELQHLRPDPGDRFLQPRPRRYSRRCALEPGSRGGGDGSTIHLAARGHRERVQEHEIVPGSCDREGGPGGRRGGPARSAVTWRSLATRYALSPAPAFPLDGATTTAERMAG